MVAPWTGFPLRKLVEWARPLPGAKYVKLTSWVDFKVSPMQAQTPNYAWPYVEAVTMEEAMNDLAFVATGLVGPLCPFLYPFLYHPV